MMPYATGKNFQLLKQVQLQRSPKSRHTYCYWWARSLMPPLCGLQPARRYQESRDPAQRHQDQLKRPGMLIGRSKWFGGAPSLTAVCSSCDLLDPFRTFLRRTVIPAMPRKPCFVSIDSRMNCPSTKGWLFRSFSPRNLRLATCKPFGSFGCTLPE